MGLAVVIWMFCWRPMPREFSAHAQGTRTRSARRTSLEACPPIRLVKVFYRLLASGERPLVYQIVLSSHEKRIIEPAAAQPETSGKTEKNIRSIGGGQVPVLYKI